MGYCSHIATERSWVQLLVAAIHYQINLKQLKVVNLMRFILICEKYHNIVRVAEHNAQSDPRAREPNPSEI